MVDLVDKYKDAAKTGRTLERPSLQKMLAEGPTIQPTYVVRWRVDYLSWDPMEIRHRPITEGVHIHYIDGRPKRGRRIGPRGVLLR